MKKVLALSLTLIFLASGLLHATKLVQVSTLDKDIVIVRFQDGEVWFRDDGTGPSAYTGHDFADGDDRMVRFGDPLNVTLCQSPGAWKITSLEDKNYGRRGLEPLKIYRKSKPNHTTHDWEYALDHWLFIVLPESLKEGVNYTLEIDEDIYSDRNRAEFRFDLEQSVSEAIHVNMIGYPAAGPIKSADLYCWLGDGGERDYSSFEGKTVYLLNTKSKEQLPVGKVSFWKKVTDTEAHGRNLTGSAVWNADFSGFDIPGTYRLLIEDVGCSNAFEISDQAYFEPYKFSVRGYYYMRIGEDQIDMAPVPRKPTFIPGKDPENFTIYLTDLHPYQPAWREHSGDTWDEPHFKPAEESMFWKHRLPGNPTTSTAVGGHSDALDWDRHLAHVSNIYDLLLPYYLSQGRLNEDNLDIAESGNGIPDLIDEARNEVDFWLGCRNGEAYAHGLTNPSSERNIMFQAGTTNLASWANAANCAMIADCFRLSGHKELERYYTGEAINAYRFAENERLQMLDVKQDVGDGVMRGRDFKMMAAAFLFNVTGDRSWEEVIASESVAVSEESNVEDRRNGIQVWGTVAYLYCPYNRNYPELARYMKASILNRAVSHNLIHMATRPSRRSSNDNYWQTPHNMHQVVLAHALTNDPAMQEKLERSMLLEADWGLGRNPSNMVEMTGLGERHVVNCYTSGRNDGTPGLHPGQTPYHNLDPWGRGKIHNGSNPPWFKARCYPDWEDGWPHQEGHFNSRYSWANAEFTPRQTMRGKMVLLAYLHFIYGLSQ